SSDVCSSDLLPVFWPPTSLQHRINVAAWNRSAEPLLRWRTRPFLGEMRYWPFYPDCPSRLVRGVGHPCAHVQFQLPSRPHLSQSTIRHACRVGYPETEGERRIYQGILPGYEERRFGLDFSHRWIHLHKRVSTPFRALHGLG